MVRFSLKSLLVSVALIGFAGVALRNGTRPWAIAWLAFSASALLTAVLACICSRGASRAFYAGCSIFGWGYLLMLYLPPLGGDVSPVTAVEQALIHCRSFVRREVPVTQDAGGGFSHAPRGASLSGDPLTGYTYALPLRQYFLVIGHAFFALIFALVGGGIARYLFVRRHTDLSPKEVNSSLKDA